MRGKLLVMVALLLVIALPAQAHNFAGSGDCDGWTLTLDGLYGATVITVDGVPVPLQLTHEIADTSSVSSRSFVVFWDKPSNDVTVTHTLYREGECTPTTTTTVQTTTTTVPVTTTTTPNVTTTTQPEVTTTTAQITTTTGQTTTTQPTTTETQPPPTTTTIEECPPGTIHQPPFCTPELVPAEPQTPTTTAPPVTVVTLPFTGPSVDPAMLGVAASVALGLGLIALGRSGRKREG